MPAAPIIPVILSGGTGVRLWPLSRLGRPKQLLSLGGGETLLQQTARRVSDGMTKAEEGWETEYLRFQNSNFEFKI